jgi:hypothetical protein
MHSPRPAHFVFALAHLGGVALLVALFYAAGYLLEAVARPPELPALGRFLTRATLGLIAWTYLLFALACLQLYRPAVVLPMAGLSLMAAIYRAARAIEGSLRAWCRRGAAGLALRARAAGADFAFAALPAAVLLAIAALALSPNIGWDCNTYHLTLPKRYIQHGGFKFLSFNVYAQWPHNVELLYGLAMMVQDHVLAKLMHTTFLGLTVLAVFRICRHRGSRAAALVATLLVLGNEVVQFEAPLAYIDIGFAFFFLFAVACADEYLGSQDRRALVASGFGCGAVAGTKLSGLVAIACVGILVLSARPASGRRLQSIALALGVPTLLLALPWYLKTYLYTGNPIYPLAYARLGGIEWNGKLGRQFMEWQQGMGMGRSLHDYLALPLRVILDASPGYGRFDGRVGSFWLVAIPIAMLASLRVRSARTYTLAAALYFGFWALSSQQLRFLIAALPPLAIAAAAGADAAINRLPWRAAQHGLRLGLVAAACIAVLPTLRPAYEGGLSQARRLVRDGPPDFKSLVPEGYAFVNARTAPDAKIMLLNTNHGFFLQREYISDSFFEASQMNWILSKADSPVELAGVLKKLGVTHVYVAAARWGIPYSDLLPRFLADSRLAELVYRCTGGGDACSIYALRDANATSPAR